MGTVESSQFPEIPMQEQAGIRVPAVILREAIRRTAFAVTTEQSRFTISGAKVLINESSLTVVATDGHRLAFARFPLVNSTGQTLDLLVPKKMLSQLEDLLDREIHRYGAESQIESGTLERLTEILTWARFVCEALKIKRDQNGKTYVSPPLTIDCGNLKDAPLFESSTEIFINAIGALAVKENAPYTILREGFGRRAGGECYDWAWKSKHWIFINLEQHNKEVPVRLKIAARANLVNWLGEQADEGARIVKIWNLEN